MRSTLSTWLTLSFGFLSLHCTTERYIYPGVPANGGSSGVASGGNSGSASTSGGASGGFAGNASGGTGIGGGTAGTGPGEVRGPTPAIPGTNFPFPQNRHNARCTYPTNYLNSAVKAAFDRWKAETVTADGAGGNLRVKRLANDAGLEQGSTVSEGIAYGMLIAVYMGDQPLFDELWRYAESWFNGNGLMNWYIKADGSGLGENPSGSGAASDADEDMAFALLMADRQWGGSGSLGDTYLNIGRGLVERIWLHEIHDGKLLMPGDSWMSVDPWQIVNPSYFAPSYYRAFGEATGNTGWLDVVTTVYDTIDNSLNAANGNESNGLVPAWCTSDGVPNVVFDGADTHYQYDSCRTPFRIGLDYCLRGEARAKTYVQKTSQFFGGIGAANIVDGYDLNGTPRPRASSGQSATFVGPATVGAMNDATHQAFIDQGYGRIAGYQALVGGEYYDGSWTVISLLMLSGNFLDYTQETPLLP